MLKKIFVFCNYIIILVFILEDIYLYIIYVYYSVVNYFLVLNIFCINKICMID